jgi:hypothetical protein
MLVQESHPATFTSNRHEKGATDLRKQGGHHSILLTNHNGVVVREASSKPVSSLHGVGALFPKPERALESLLQ